MRLYLLEEPDHLADTLHPLYKMSFQARLQKMDKDQLFAALDQIQTLELADDERMLLVTGVLIGPLVQADPELLLNRFSDRLNDETPGIGGQLAAAIGEWAKQDQAAADWISNRA